MHADLEEETRPEGNLNRNFWCIMNDEKNRGHINLNSFITGLLRALFLRCPNCGKGKLFRRGYTMYEKCSVCGWRFERESGYWTGAIALNLAVTELLIAIFVVPFAAWLAITQQPITLLIIGLPLPFILPFLFFRHAKSFWMSFDFRVHPVDPEELR